MALTTIDPDTAPSIVGLHVALDAMTDMRAEEHGHSIAHAFPRPGETGTTQAITALLPARSA